MEHAGAIEKLRFVAVACMDFRPGSNVPSPEYKTFFNYESKKGN
jgi:hypothetical protein